MTTAKPPHFRPRPCWRLWVAAIPRRSPTSIPERSCSILAPEAASTYCSRHAASGHPGSITSCHAGSPALAFEQLAIMIQDSPGGANLTFDVIKRLLTLTIDIVVQFQNHDGERFISEIYFDPQKKLAAVS